MTVTKEPLNKTERRRNKALTRFVSLVYRNLRRFSRRVDLIEVRVQDLEDLRHDVQEIARVAAQAERRANEALALYYDTHDTIDGEHEDHGRGVAEHRDPTLRHVGGGVFDEATAKWIDPRTENPHGR